MANEGSGADGIPRADESPTAAPVVDASLQAGPFRLKALNGNDDFPTIAGFRISARLGQGGMGVVYRAFQESMRREVALKIISPQQSRDRGFWDRFLREA